MIKRSFWLKIVEQLVPLIYLIFPIVAIFADNITRPRWEYIIVVIIFTLDYIIILFKFDKLNSTALYGLFIIHYLIIMYFVISGQPMNVLFYFFSAFAIPFWLKKNTKSLYFLTFVIAMVMTIGVVYVTQPDNVFYMSIYLIVILLFAIGNIRAAEDRKIKDELIEKNKYINTLIAEQERNRIGQDLHDTLGHVFASMTLKAELASKLIDHDTNAAKKEIQALETLSRDTLKKVRSIIEDLKIQTFDEEILAISQVLEDAHIEFSFTNKNIVQSMNPARQSMLAMILREAINNVLKHAHATEVTGELKEKDNRIIMTIHDNGQGIDDPKNVTLKSIKERCDYLKGELNIYSNQNEGTTLVIDILRSETI